MSTTTSSAATIRRTSAILADARTFLRQMLAELERRSPKRSDALKAWHADIAKWRRPGTSSRSRTSISTPRRSGPERIVADCQAVLPDDAILACDVGVNHNWYMQFWKARRPQTMLNSWGFSGMGFGAAGVARRQAGGARPAVRGDLPATAASRWCRTCCARRWSTTSRSCG